MPMLAIELQSFFSPAPENPSDAAHLAPKRDPQGSCESRARLLFQILSCCSGWARFLIKLHRSVKLLPQQSSHEALLRLGTRFGDRARLHRSDSLSIIANPDICRAGYGLSALDGRGRDCQRGSFRFRVMSVTSRTGSQRAGFFCGV